MEDRPRIVQNAVRVISTGEVYRSWHRHDWVSIKTEQGDCFIDGGNDYIRHSIGPAHPDIEWMCLDESDSWRQFDKKLIVKMIDGPDRLLSSLTAKELGAVRTYTGMHRLSEQAIKRVQKRAGITKKRVKKPAAKPPVKK